MEDKQNLSFEEAITRLEIIVKELESGNIDLDNAINKYSEGMALAKICGDKLNDATERVNKILRDNNTLEDFTPQSE